MKYLLFAAAMAFSLTACVTPAEESNTPITNEEGYAPTVDARCAQTGETGRCRAMFTKYQFNATTKQCEAFTWGGCGGVVPFQTMEECQKICQ